MRVPKTLLATAVAVLAAADAGAWVTYANFPRPARGSGRFTPPTGGPGLMPYVYDVASAPPGFAGAAGTAIVTAAHQTWNDDPGSQVAFALAGEADCDCSVLADGTNCVEWNAAGAAGALAVTRVRSVAAGTLDEFDICINPNMPRDLQGVLLHELGHALGLDHTDASIDPAQPGLNGQRPSVEYFKTVMQHFIGLGVVKQTLSCDDKAGANFLYPPAGVVMEPRSYMGGNTGGCDFGDAPDPLTAVIGEYPSLENGEDRIINGNLDAEVDNPPLGNYPGAEDVDLDGNGTVDLDEDQNLIGVFPELGNGARHKDSRMEWLGPIDMGAGQVTLPQPFAGQPATLVPKNPVLPPPPNGFVGGFPGSVVAGQTGDPGPAVPASATFETDARLADADELDDGVSLRGPLVGGVPVTVDVLVNTSGLAPGRYDEDDPDSLLYLNAWEDWNGDGDWQDWAPPIAGGLVAGLPPCVPPAPSDEYALHWRGTPGSDVAFSPNFCGGTPAGPNARYLTFIVTPPPGTWNGDVYERFRLDWGENVGQNPRDFSDPSLTFEQGEAKYGEVEDYAPFEIDFFPESLAEVDLRVPAGSPTPLRLELQGPTTVVVDLGRLGDGDGDGRESVPTEIVDMSLTGVSPLGPVVVRIRDAARHPFERTTGEIEEMSNLTSGQLDLPPFVTDPEDLTAASFFEVFFEIEVVNLGLLLHNHEPKRVESEISHKPPAEGEVYESPEFIRLYDENETLVAEIGPIRHVPDPVSQEITDCNNNGIDDLEDIANGTSEDINDNDKPDECEIRTISCPIRGTAEGGTVSVTIVGFFDTCNVVLATSAGQSAATVVASLAAAINANACLADQNITAVAVGGNLQVTGFALDLASLVITFDDPGLELVTSVIKIPTLSAATMAILALFLLALGLMYLKRQRLAR